MLSTGSTINGSSYNLMDPTAHLHHSRRLSNAKSVGMGISPSVNQFVTTPRRSIDVDSNMDDDTSYDSTSQISLDPNSNYDLNFVANQQKLMFPDGIVNSSSVDSNQATTNSINLIKQQYYLQQQYQDLTSFETIKRVLFNGSNFLGSNMSNSGVGSQGLEDTTLLSSAGGTLNHPNGIGIFLNMQTPTNESGPVNGFVEEEKNTKIISEFKQKPFEELRQSLQRANNQSYQQVVDFISKEIAAVHSMANNTNYAASQANAVMSKSTLVFIIQKLDFDDRNKTGFCL